MLYASSLSIIACGLILPVSLCLGALASLSPPCRAVLLYLNKSILLQLGFFSSIPRHYELFAVQSTLIFHSPGKAVDEQHRGIWGESGFKKEAPSISSLLLFLAVDPLSPPALLYFLFSENATSSRGVMQLEKSCSHKDRELKRAHKAKGYCLLLPNVKIHLVVQTVVIFGTLAL